MNADPTTSNSPAGGLSTLFFRNRHLLVLFMIVILVAGYSAINSLPRLEDPVITNRAAQILTIYPGATPERVEALVTEKIEQELKEIPEIKHIETTSQAGVSVVAVELEDAVTPETNKTIFSEVRDRLADAADEFPEGVLPPEFDDKRNAVAFTLIVELKWEDGREEALGVLHRQAEVLADRLRGVSGTELVRIYGEPEEEVTVTVDDAELNALGLTIRDVSNALSRADAKVPSGVIRGENASLLVEVQGELDSVTRVEEVPLLQTESGQVTVSDVAEVRRGYRQPPVEMAFTEGERSILVAARVREDRRVDLWTVDAKAAVESFRETLGAGISSEIAFEQNEYTSERLGTLVGNLLLGALVVFLVIFLTMGWKSSFIVGSALPLTAAMTLFVVAMSGGKLHQMSIFGMIIALGLLIDNAIVITDEVRKHLREGNSGLESVRLSLQHLFLPLLSSTLTTMLAFMPILLLPGNAGDFVSSIGQSVVIALTCSFLISMTIIASLAGIFGSQPAHPSRWFGWLSTGMSGGWLGNAFAQLVRLSVKTPVLGILLALVIPVIGFALSTTLGSQFFPRTDRNMFQVEVWLPTESSVNNTRALTEEIEEIIRQRPEVQKVSWLVGGSYPSVYYNLIMNKDNSPFYSQAIVTASSFKAVSEMIAGLQKDIDERVPQAQAVVKKFAQGPPAEADVEIRLLGPSIETLQDLGEQVRLQLAQHPEILQTRVTMPRGEPKLFVNVDENEARLAGLTLQEVAGQLQGAMEGYLGGSVLEEIEDLPVRIRYENSRRDEVADIANMRLISQQNPQDWLPLSALGEVELRPEIGGISRRDGLRNNTILGYAKPGSLPIEITNDVIARLDASGFRTPDGYTLELGGEAENQAEAVGNLTLFLPIIIVCTIALLVLTFKSVRIAVILLLAAPLSVGYGLLATWAMQFPLSFNTIIGSLGLMGLAFNSSIVVLAAIRAHEKASAGDPDSIVEQALGSSRHLISTTLTTMGSFLPLLIFVGGEFWPPLAIVLAGGVGGSTLLALTFTPAAYRLFMRDRRESVVSGT